MPFYKNAKKKSNKKRNIKWKRLCSSSAVSRMKSVIKMKQCGFYCLNAFIA